MLRLLIVLSFSIALLAFGVNVFKETERKVREETYLNKNEFVSEFNDFINLYNKTSLTKDEIKELKIKYNNLKNKVSNNDLKNLNQKIELKEAILHLFLAEDELNKAFKIQSALAVSPETPHPLADDLLDKSKNNYEISKRIFDSLYELNNDSEFNFILNFYKGVVYHRYLQMFSDQQTAKEYLNMTLNAYKQALKHKDADINTTVNLELLLKDPQNGGSGNGEPKDTKTKMLNQAASGNNLKGN